MPETTPAIEVFGLAKRYGDLQSGVLSDAQAQAEGRRVLSINTVQPTLEDVFVQLTGLSAEVIRWKKGERESEMLARRLV